MKFDNVEIQRPVSLELYIFLLLPTFVPFLHGVANVR